MRQSNRAIRRAEISRLKKVRSRYYRFWNKTPANLGKIVNTACLCSCWMCGNPRKTKIDHRSGLTLKERSAKAMFKMEVESFNSEKQAFDTVQTRSYIIELVSASIGLDLDEPETRPEYPIKDWGLDELDTVRLILGLESRFNIEIEDREFESCVTFDQLIKLVVSKL